MAKVEFNFPNVHTNTLTKIANLENKTLEQYIRKLMYKDIRVTAKQLAIEGKL
ncbi:TPA: hypothetical protein M2Q89_000719 [Escherichia coli]|nr:hypothetical protein [Escherichia coli]